ncbi:MAG: response regulator [Actinophytocola sp.]|nr:response regulator [Actinophytocola sp.]
MTTRVAVVDGHTLTRFGVAGLLADQPDLDVVAQAGSAAEAKRIIVAEKPDVVTVAVGLPDGDGLQLARELRDRYPDLGIVVLTSNGEDDVLFRALENGASAFVAKTAPISEVLSAIRHAAVAASSFTATGLATALVRRRSAPKSPGLGLSAREAEVLRLLCDGLSTPAIARQLFVSTSTAKTYVARLYEKLGTSNRAQVVMVATRDGLIQHRQAPLTAS